MKRILNFLILACLLPLFVQCSNPATAERSTSVEIRGEKFYINGSPTYEGRTWKGKPVEGLLMNSRMVQGIFDDSNPATAGNWKYPDTGTWDPDRNTDEFVEAMEEWVGHGMLAFTINLQGGSPMGYGNQGWRNTAFDEQGRPVGAYFHRLEKILDRADELGMVAILGIFYFGQDQYLDDDQAIYSAIDHTLDWLYEKGYRNILIELNNECSVDAWDHEILRDPHVSVLIDHVSGREEEGYSYPVGTSYGGGDIPSPEVVAASDFVLIHGNGVSEPDTIRAMVDKVRALPTYRTMPVLFNEDDHYDFDREDNNCIAAVESYASWGYFDFRRDGEAFEQGYQSVPVHWGIESDRKKGFFSLVKEITGVK